jgi:Conjugative transposon protein TcpC
MPGRVELVTRSPRMTRVLAGGPRALLLLTAALLAIAGARSAIAGPDGSPPPRRAPAAGQDLVAAGFAQSFARAYLTWDARRPELHAEQIAPYVSQRLDAGAGLELPDRGSQGVLWTAPVQDRRTGERERTITVAAQTTRSIVHLAVPVQRDDRGFLVVPRYPAIVGPPVSDPAQKVADEEPVEDGALRAVAERAVTNYVEGEREDLRADLDGGAVVSLPVTPLRIRSVEPASWAAPGRVAVTVTADGPDGASWTLRYELSVVRRDRWYVRAIAIDPTSKEVIR